jgi:hypothetical protein
VIAFGVTWRGRRALWARAGAGLVVALAIVGLLVLSGPLAVAVGVVLAGAWRALAGGGLRRTWASARRWASGVGAAWRAREVSVARSGAEARWLRAALFAAVVVAAVVVLGAGLDVLSAWVERL